MKQARRKELKTNLLSLELQKMYETLNRYATHLVVAAVVVGMILAGWWYTRSQAHAATQQAWREYFAVSQLDPTDDQVDAIDRARDLVAGHGLDKQLGPEVRDLLGRMIYARAMSLDLTADPSERLNLLAEADEVYQALIDTFSDQPFVVARARIMRASIQESRLVAGKGSLETVREIYQALIDAESAIYRPLATNLLSTVEERTRKLVLVAATQPAALPTLSPGAIPPPPVPVPAPATGPAAGPASGGTTQPAE